MPAWASVGVRMTMNWHGQDVENVVGPSLNRPGDPDFWLWPGVIEATVSDDSPEWQSLWGYLTSRKSQARDDLRRLPSWSANVKDPFLRLSLELSIRDDITAVRVVFRDEPPTLVTPVSWHEVQVLIPVRVFADLGFERVPCGLWLVASIERVVQGYARWQRWDPPEPLPRTRAEREWLDEHAAPLEPGEGVGLVWSDPPPERNGQPMVWRVLADLPATDSMVRAEALTQRLRGAKRQDVLEIVGGWTYLLHGMGTESHLLAAERVLGEPISDDDFADLRSWVALAAEEPGRTTDVDYFTQVLSRLHQGEDLDQDHLARCCELLGLMMERVSDDMTAQYEFPDPWQIRAG